VLRRCVWSRNIKNRCSIYIYDISRLRVKWRPHNFHSQPNSITKLSGTELHFSQFTPWISSVYTQRIYLRELAFNTLRLRYTWCLLVHNNESIAEVLYRQKQNIKISEIRSSEVSRRWDNGSFSDSILAFDWGTREELRKKLYPALSDSFQLSCKCNRVQFPIRADFCYPRPEHRSSHCISRQM